MRKIYTFFKNTHPDIEIAKLYIIEDLFNKEGYIEILNNELTPLIIKMAHKKQNNIIGVEAILEDRCLPPNRMFLEEYCKEHDLDVNNLDDRISLSEGRTLDDDYYIKMEILNE